MNTIQTLIDIIRSGSFQTLLQAAACFLIGLIVIRIVLRLIEPVLQRSRLDPVLHSFIINCVKVACYSILVITALNLAGIPTSTFITVLAAAGAAVALAIKDSLSNFAGGILILISKPFSRGDLVECNGVTGKVDEIDLLYSRLITFDNKRICMPNSILANNAIINYSGEDLRRIDLKVSAGYDDDIDHVKSVIRSVIEGSDYFRRDPAPMIGVSEYADSAVIYDAFAWCETDSFFDARYYLLENIKKAFDREGIQIPYQQIVVHIEGEKQK